MAPDIRRKHRTPAQDARLLVKQADTSSIALASAQRACAEKGGEPSHLCAVPVEHFDQFGEVSKGTAQSVDFVTDDGVDKPVLDVRDQSHQGRPVQCATQNAAVIVLVAEQYPAFRALAGDIRFAGFALGMK